jgi:hypothetical protein
VILDRLIDKLGDSNPQIFRELKERLKLRNIGIAIIGSLVIQAFILLYFNAQIPMPVLATPQAISSPATQSSNPIPSSRFKDTYSKYCQISINKQNYSQLCEVDGSDNFKINWQKWRSDLFICLSWTLPLGLILGSVYMLVADLVQEEKRGTLNFIRLSPQSARKIFIGKILGVPVLVYLAVALMVPLHLWMGFSAQATVPLLASWYLTIGSIWLLLSSGAVLYVLLGGVQAIITVIAVAFPNCLPLAVINVMLSATIDREAWLTDSEHIAWFGLRISDSAILFYAFATGSCLLASYWVWQALERRYLNPTATVISKYQSYVVNFCCQLWIAGFTIPLVFADPDKYYDTRQILSVLAMIDFVALLSLIPMLLPTKQALQDWSRYRRERTYQRRKFWQRDLFRDLIGNDKSPALLTIAINVGMALVVWIPTAILALTVRTRGMRFNEFSTPGHVTRIVMGIGIAASLILIYSAIAHLGLFLKVRKHRLWIAAIVSVMMFLPLAGAYVLSPMHTPTGLAAILLLFSPFGGIAIFQLGGLSILAILAAQVTMFTALTHQLQRKLKISGQSPTKELLAQS